MPLQKDGELYRILTAAKARSGSGKSLNLDSHGELPPGSGVTVVRLEHIAPSQMAKILEPLAPEKSILRVDDPRNLMILSATGPEMKSLLETIETFDVSPLKGMSFGYFKLKNAKTPQVTTELKEIDQDLRQSVRLQPAADCAHRALERASRLCLHVSDLKAHASAGSRASTKPATTSRRAFMSTT